MTKGNIVRSNRAGRDGIVLAVRKDGTSVKVFDYKTGHTVWVPVAGVTVTIDDDRRCGKCGGDGLFKFDNGNVGKCNACAGKGYQHNDDRVRNHHYWHRQGEIEDALLAIDRGEEPPPLSTPYMPKATPEDVEEWKAAVKPKPTIKDVVKRKSKRDPRSTVVQPANELDKLKMTTAQLDELRDRGENISHERCPNCGTGHRYDVACL